MLHLPKKFKQALGGGVRTSLYPVVIIGSDIHLSIKATTIGGKACDPLLLSSPSIKSSADIINNKYTISSVSLSISNAVYHGKTFSDIIPDLLNEETKIYYSANGLNDLDDCLLVYTGKIRRYSQSAETIKLTLEDLTEEKLSTQIPVTKIPDEDEFRSEDVGKVYPMVYGRVDNSPTIIKASYDALNDELTEDITELILEKPSQRIKGAWTQSNEGDYGHEHLNNTEHILVRDNWIKLQNFFLSINDNGFLPVNQTIGKEWGENDLDEEATFYNFNNASDGTSANIRLSPITQEIDLNADGDYIDDGEQVYGIPSRVYRPIDSVGFFNYEYESRHHGGGEAYNEPRTANRFYSFTGDEKDTDLWDPRKETISSIDTEPYDDNQDCQAKDRYDELFDGNNEPTDEFWSSGWWGATDVNVDSDANNDEQSQERAKTWAAVDVFWEALYGKSVARLPIDRIQDSSFDTGLHLNSKNTELEGGAFARIKVLDNIGDFPCFTKIVFQVTMYTCSPPDEGGIGSTGSRFWTDRNLIQITAPYMYSSNVNTLDGILDYNDPNYQGSNMETSGDGVSVPFDEDQEISRDISDEGELGDYEGSFGLNKWSKTKAFDSIQWGAPQVYAINSDPDNITPYHISDLCGVYVLQDILIDDLLSREYFASVEGRVKSNDNSISLIQDIAEDILENELEFDGVINKGDEDETWKFDFTLNEQTETKTVFEDLFNSSLLIPSFNSKNEFRFINIHQTMSAEFIGELRIIKNEDIVKYSFDLTKLDDVYSSVNVKYKKNYASGDFDKETGYSLSYNNIDYSNYEELSEEISEADSYDIDYYHINHSDAKLEVETEYIRDKSTAERLQKRLLMWHINQHLIARIDLPPHYMDLEAGDYIKFDELIGGKLAFGYDYTEPERRNGQLIYPVFFITKVSKSITKVTIEAIQIHRGQFGYPEDDYDDDDLIVNSDKIDITDQFQIPDPNDDPDYQDGTIDDGFIDGDPVIPIEDYFNLYWLDAANRLDLSPITAILSTTNLTGWIYDIWIVNVETPDGGGIHEEIDGEQVDIAEGEHNIGRTHGDLLTFNSAIIVGNGGSIAITKKMIFDEGTTIDFVLQVKSFDGLMFDTLTFQQLGEPPYVPLLGDVNDDGIVNVLDVVLIVSYIMAGEAENLPEQADINGDGVFDVLDIVGLLDYIITGDWQIIIDDGDGDDEDDDGTGGGE